MFVLRIILDEHVCTVYTGAEQILLLSYDITKKKGVLTTRGQTVLARLVVSRGMGVYNFQGNAFRSGNARSPCRSFVVEQSTRCTDTIINSSSLLIRKPIFPHRYVHGIYECTWFTQQASRELQTYKQLQQCDVV